MSVTAGVDYSYTVRPGTSDVQSRAATIHGTGATAVVANWGLVSDTNRADTVNLSADLSSAASSTPTSNLTASLALLLKGATHVNQASGAREINDGVSSRLSSQIGQLLVGAGFSQTDAAKASTSLAQQLASSSPASEKIGLSLTSQTQKAGTTSASLSGGQVASAYNVQSTATLNIAFDARNGDLSVNLSEHKVAATRIEWSAATATDVSISLTQPELEAIGFGPTGTSQNQTGSPVQETVTSSYQSSGFSGVGSGNITGPNALGSYLGFEKQVIASASPTAGIPTPIDVSDPLSAGSAKTLSDHNAADAAVLALRSTMDDASGSGSSGQPVTLSSSAGASTKSSKPSEPVSSKQAAAEAALLALKKMVTDARATQLNHDQSTSRSLNFSVTQPVGIAVADQSGNKFLIYERSNQNPAIVGLPSQNLKV